MKYINLDQKRKAIMKVKEILEPLGDFIAAVEGASASSYTKDGVIKDMRELLIDYEKSIGEDPEHDWSKEQIEHENAEIEIKKKIIQYEKALLDPEIRADAKKVYELMSENFFEFGVSGGLFRYKPGDTFINNDGRVYTIEGEVEVRLLSDDIAQATYAGTMTIDSKVSRANRSSIWKLEDDGWKMIFHQGTPMKN